MPKGELINSQVFAAKLFLVFFELKAVEQCWGSCKITKYHDRMAIGKSVLWLFRW